MTQKLLYTICVTLLVGFMQGCIGDDIISDRVVEVIRISNPIDSLAAGETYQLEAQYFDNIGRETAITINWRTSDTTILAVNETGLLEGRMAGRSYVIAQVLGIEGTITDSMELVVGENTVLSANERTGSLQTTSSYTLEGDFRLTETDDGLVLELGENYRASSNLPGLVVYLTNNPNTINGALEISDVTIFSGAHSYVLDESVEINDYEYVLYFCKPFRVKVGDGQFDN